MIGDAANAHSLHFVRTGDATQKWPKPLLKRCGYEWPPILCAEHRMRVRADLGHEGIQPSLRDLRNRRIEPDSELPGYFRISLREAETTHPLTNRVFSPNTVMQN